MLRWPIPVRPALRIHRETTGRIAKWLNREGRKGQAEGAAQHARRRFGVLRERVMGFEPTNGSLGSYCLTTWRHPLDCGGL